jgi:hypothetical protein
MQICSCQSSGNGTKCKQRQLVSVWVIGGVDMVREDVLIHV